MQISVNVNISNHLSIDGLVQLIKAYNLSTDTKEITLEDLNNIRFSLLSLMSEIETKIKQHPDTKAQEGFDKLIKTCKIKGLIDQGTWINDSRAYLGYK